jgi:uncharacterized protein (TIGR00369 family)
MTAQVPPTDENPLLDYLGVRLVEWEPGLAVFQLDIEPRHLNRQGSLQGGVTATMLDAACGYAGLRVDPDRPPDNAVTVTLNISYIAKIRTGRLIATGRLTTAGHKLYFASGELRSQDGVLVATAQGAFKFGRAAESGETAV